VSVATRLLTGELTREHRKIALFVALSFFCLGLPRVITNATAFALFLDTFGAARLPYTYLGAAALAPLIGAGYLWLNRRVSFWTLILSALAFDAIALGLAWIALQTPLARAAIALLAVWVEVEWMLAGLVFWGLAERMFTLRDAKRLFGLIGAGEPAAVIAGGFAIPLLLTLIGARDLIIVSAVAMVVAAAVVLAVRSRFGADLATGHSEEDEPSGFKVLGGFGRYQSYVNLIFLMVVLAEIAHFVVDNAFYDVAEARYPEKDALASFIGVFFAVSGAVNLLCNVFVSGRLLRSHGVGTAMLSLPVLVGATGVLAIAAARGSGAGMAFFTLIALTKLIDEAVRNGIYTAGFLTVYQPLPPELRTRAHAASGSYVEQIAAGVAGLALLGLNLALGFGALELTMFAVVVSIAWAIVARRQFQRYLEVLGHAIAHRRLPSTGVSLDDEGSLAVAAQRLAAKEPGEAIYALSLIEAHAPHHLPGAVRKLLPHPSADVRREALRAAERAAPAELIGDIDAVIDDDKDEEVVAGAMRALAAIDEMRAMERLVPFLDHASAQLRRGAVTGLMRYCGIDGTLAAGETFKALLASPRKDERDVAGMILEELASPHFFRPLVANITSRDRAAQRSALRAARRVNVIQLRPVLLDALRSPHIGRGAAVALVNAGDAVLPQLIKLFDEERSDAGTRARIAWTLGRIGSPAALKALFDRLDRHGLDERLHVARALGHAKFLADPPQGRRVWAEIEAAQAVADLLETGVAVEGRDERVMLLRTTCHEAMVRERERLFLLLAMVLPRERVLQVAWRHGRASEELRAYAMELLDTLLPPRYKPLVLRLLGETPAARAAAAITADAFNDRIRSEIPINAWIRSCAIYAAQNDEEGLEMLTIERVMILRSVELFSDVPSQFLVDIAEVVGEHEIARGETVIREGEMGDKLYVVVHGTFEVTRGGQPIAVVGPRQVFGELAALDPEPRAATVTAATDGLLFSLEFEQIDELMAGSMEIAHGFIRMLCRRVRDTNARVTAVTAAPHKAHPSEAIGASPADIAPARSAAPLKRAL
jgi:CRP-like cAMP-binding protein/HEAT repeat protein